MAISLLKYNLRRWSIKLLNWEYWPMWVVYFPVSFYYIYLSIKAKSFFFFSAANPSIETGGAFFESKWKIFELIPPSFFPKTIYVGENEGIDTVQKALETAKLTYPIIAKPDRGERGWLVSKIKSRTELSFYINSTNIPFLIQEYIDFPLELSVFYYRHPSSNKGTVTSVTFKKLLTLVGDGISDIEQLIVKNNRSFLQYHRLKQSDTIALTNVLSKGEELVIVPYGNHVLGAEFLNYNHIIDEQLNQTFDKISAQIEGFYFGRFDLRCNSIDELKQGKNISILELNGVGAEPAHIYQPGFSFFKGQKVIAQHYRMMFDAAIYNNSKGISYLSYQEFKNWRKLEKEHKLKASS